MSKTTDVLIKWAECGPMELTEAEKQFCKLVKIKATPMLGKDLQPGDLFSMAPPSYWNQIDTNGSVGGNRSLGADHGAARQVAQVVRTTVPPSRYAGRHSGRGIQWSRYRISGT